MRSQKVGTSSDGFMTTGQPAAIAPMSGFTVRPRGAFHGLRGMEACGQQDSYAPVGTRELRQLWRVRRHSLMLLMAAHMYMRGGASAGLHFAGQTLSFPDLLGKRDRSAQAVSIRLSGSSCLRA